MSHPYIFDLLSLIPLTWVLYYLWRQRKEFRSLIPFLLGALSLISGRILEVIVEHPGLHELIRFGQTSEQLEYYFLVASDLAEMGAILFFVVGFAQTIHYMKSGKDKIESYEILLPICASCKKIRSNDDHWEPVEAYLHKSGAPPLTHSLCPSCEADFRRRMEKEKLDMEK
jgi:hypothetical protein